MLADTAGTCRGVYAFKLELGLVVVDYLESCIRHNVHACTVPAEPVVVLKGGRILKHCSV
jgi:hypothetical protein